ncbi:hypothetical protein ACFRI7_20580 [Streptomyces sp. NPDC056716]|uniref:hypothetical protein n=1 Tax=unclassified Streptomyces TaxID=2593676 RepID=UPI0036956CE5
MKAEREGRTAPWAKALGAVLLIPALVLVTVFAVGRYRESGREREAFEATRTDAARFADALVAAEDPTPSDQDVQAVLDRTSIAGPRNGALVEVRPTEHGTRILVQFSRTYERNLAVLGPAEAMATRCFTVDLPAAVPVRAQVTPHGPEKSCLSLAASSPS